MVMGGIDGGLPGLRQQDAGPRMLTPFPAEGRLFYFVKRVVARRGWGRQIESGECALRILYKESSCVCCVRTCLWGGFWSGAWLPLPRALRRRRRRPRRNRNEARIIQSRLRRRAPSMFHLT